MCAVRSLLYRPVIILGTGFTYFKCYAIVRHGTCKVETKQQIMTYSVKEHKNKKEMLDTQ